MENNIEKSLQGWMWDTEFEENVLGIFENMIFTF